MCSSDLEVLPGGDLSEGNATEAFDAFYDELCNHYPEMPGLLLARMARRHGSQVREILAGAKRVQDLGENFGGGLHEAEVRWLIANEWARESDDVLWRRTKCGLHMNRAEREAFARWMESNASHTTPESNSNSGMAN